MIIAGGEWKLREMAKDITNKRFGRLVALEPTEITTKYDGVKWHCQCDCGNKTIVAYRSLTTGNTRSCGCLLEEQRTKNGTTKGVPAMHKGYENSRVDNIPMANFKKKKAKNNTSGYKGVQSYKTRSGVKYKAKLTVGGKHYHAFGFDTAKDAYYNGRLVLEDEHLPKE